MKLDPTLEAKLKPPGQHLLLSLETGAPKYLRKLKKAGLLEKILLEGQDRMLLLMQQYLAQGEPSMLASLLAMRDVVEETVPPDES